MIFFNLPSESEEVTAFNSKDFLESHCLTEPALLCATINQINITFSGKVLSINHKFHTLYQKNKILKIFPAPGRHLYQKLCVPKVLFPGPMFL